MSRPATTRSEPAARRGSSTTRSRGLRRPARQDQRAGTGRTGRRRRSIASNAPPRRFTAAHRRSAPARPIMRSPKSRPGKAKPNSMPGRRA
ncbi:MAG: hypothetical protein MZV49_16595 [Rhodopseudomonas palustris]|nr:hypothetical protein [Rhodopseudomonas palustris]